MLQTQSYLQYHLRDSEWFVVPFLLFVIHLRVYKDEFWTREHGVGNIRHEIFSREEEVVGVCLRF